MTTDLKFLAKSCAASLPFSDAPETEAYELIKYVFGVDRTSVILNPVREVSESSLSRFDECVKKRQSGYPLQYIIGEWDFYGHTFSLNDGVLIPRCETEQIADEGCKFLRDKKNQVVFDLCAGSGCIGLSVAAANPTCQVYLFDVTDKAIACQNDNLRLMSLDNVRILDYDIFYGFNSELLPYPNIILSNPPYVSDENMNTLQREVYFEPTTAVYGGTDGLDFYRCIAESWLPYLENEGFFMLECGEEQPDVVLQLIDEQHLPLDCRIEEDICGIRRFVSGVRHI